jgi:arginine:pyruvate transaminase
MRYAAVTDRLARLGSDKWAVHHRAKAMAAEGREVIFLSIGEPDLPTPPALMDRMEASMRAGRTGYSNGRGEPALLAALAARYSRRTGRRIGTDQFLCLPGTQTALYTVLTGLVQAGDEVLVGDPMYATYEGLIRSTGAAMVPVPLRPERCFRMAPEDVAARVTPATQVLFLNSPHNPTGAVLRADDLRALGAIAEEHDLWIVSDEVYEELTFGADFVSPFDLPETAARTVACSSISKSHAAPGFRSGWCVGPAEFTARLLPLSETMLFGSQPFIAEMTALAVSEPSAVAAELRTSLARRAELVVRALDGPAGLRVARPEAGMFVLIDVRATGRSGEDFAWGLLEEAGVALMPGASFGAALDGWVRLGLTAPEEMLARACGRIADFAAGLPQRKSA